MGLALSWRKSQYETSLTRKDRAQVSKRLSLSAIDMPFGFPSIELNVVFEILKPFAPVENHFGKGSAFPLELRV